MNSEMSLKELSTILTNRIRDRRASNKSGQGPERRYFVREFSDDNVMVFCELLEWKWLKHPDILFIKCINDTFELSSQSNDSFPVRSHLMVIDEGSAVWQRNMLTLLFKLNLSDMEMMWNGRFIVESKV